MTSTGKTASKRARKPGRKPSRVFALRGKGTGARALMLRTCAVISGLGALSLLFVWGYHYIVESRYLTLTDIQVEGVEEVLKVELLLGAGLTRNVSLLALNLHELKSIFEAHPWIRQARVERRFPHGLHITVEKEIPAAIVVTDRLFYMNTRGQIFKPVNIDDSLDFPVVTGVSTPAAESREQLRQAAHVIASVEREDPPWSAEALSEVHINPDGFVSLYFNHLNAEIRVAWSDVEGKMPGLRQVVSHLRKNGRLGRVAAIDLNQETGAVVSMTNG